MISILLNEYVNLYLSLYFTISLYFVPQSAFYPGPVTAVCSLLLNAEQFSIPECSMVRLSQNIDALLEMFELKQRNPLEGQQI